MTRIRCSLLFASAGLAALVGCGGTGEDAPTSTAVIDTSSLATYDAIAQAVAAEHGAPGENEQLQYVLVGENATPDLVTALHERGFSGVSMGDR